MGAAGAAFSQKNRAAQGEGNFKVKSDKPYIESIQKEKRM